jgi:chloramphenicol O-acetyltransferase type A
MEAGKEQLAKPAGQGLSPNDARSDMVFYSVLPWLSFTGFKNAHHHIEMDHFPRMVTGKPYQQGKDWYMPLSIEVHHALADGRHVAAVFNGLQEILGT